MSLRLLLVRFFSASKCVSPSIENLINTSKNTSRFIWTSYGRELRCVKKSDFIANANVVMLPKPTDHVISCPVKALGIPEGMTIHKLVWISLSQCKDLPALTDGIDGVSFTYSAARAASSEFSKSLVKMGVKKGDIVAVALPNCPLTAIAFLGIVEAGGVAALLPFEESLGEINLLYGELKPRVIVTVSLAARRLCKVREADLIIIVTDWTERSSKNWLNFDDLIKGEVPEQFSKAEESEVEVSPSDLAMVAFTNYYEMGRYRAAKLTHANVVTSILQNNHPHFNSCNVSSDQYQEVVLSSMPLYHVFGMITLVLTKMNIGAHLVIMQNYSDEYMLHCLQKHKVTVVQLCRKMLNYLSQFPSKTAPPPELLRPIKSVLYSSFHAPRQALVRLRSYIDHGAIIQQGYGMTETSGYVTLPLCFEETLSDEPRSSVGYVLPYSKIKILHLKKKKIIGANKMGEILINGPQLMQEYFNDSKEPEIYIDDEGWLHTGDFGYFTENHSVYIVDRMANMMEIQGRMVSPKDMEAYLLELYEIEDAAVVGVPCCFDDQGKPYRYEDAPLDLATVARAYLVRRSGIDITASDIRAYLKKKMDVEHQVLRGGIFFVEEIPRSSTGRILRKQLLS